MITDHHAIHALLGRLVSERVMLSIFLPTATERFDSLLLGLEREHDALVADELRPAVGHRLVAPGVSLRIVTRLDGVEVRFRTNVRAIDKDGPVAAYLLDVPDELDYRERRQSYRVRIPPQKRVVAQLTGPKGETIAAVVADISLAGIGFVVPYPNEMRALDVWQCHVALPDGALVAAIELRYVLADGRNREARVGARFVDLALESQRRIGRFATETQRRLLRARRSLKPQLDS